MFTRGEIEVAVARVLNMTDPEPPPAVAGYAYAGWEEDVKKEHEAHRQCLALRLNSTAHLVAEIGRRLLLEQVDDIDVNVLRLTLAAKLEDEPLASQVRDEVQCKQDRMEACRKYWRERLKK